MNRRESLKALGLTVVSSGVLMEACKTKDTQPASVEAPVAEAGREKAVDPPEPPDRADSKTASLYR